MLSNGRCCQLNGCAVGQNFGDSWGEFGGVKAKGDDGVSFHFFGVFHHAGEGFLASGGANAGVSFIVPAQQLLKAAHDGFQAFWSANDSAGGDANVFGDGVAGNFVAGGGDEWRRNGSGRRGHGWSSVLGLAGENGELELAAGAGEVLPIGMGV